MINHEDLSHTSRSSRRNDGPVQSGLGDEVDLDGGVASRVVDGAGVNLGDCHIDLRSSRKMSEHQKRLSPSYN